MFKFRSGGQGASSPAQPPTIEAMRRRARHRLIGASVLVLAGVIGFPLLFDSQPRPISVDIPIDIPAKSSAKPLTLVKPDQTAPAPVVDGLDAREEVVASAKPVAKVAVVESKADKSPSAPVEAPKAVAKAPEPKAEPKPEPKAPEPVKSKVEPKPEPKPEAKSSKTDKADKPADKGDKADGNARLIVQVGAFAEADRAREVRQKLEHAGLKTYTHVAETPDGKRIRVRVGPFASRAEADKVAAKVKTLGLPAAILTL